MELNLEECLKAAGIAVLPAVADSSNEKTWVQAVALVKKVDGTKNYAIVRRVADGGSPELRRDFGRQAAISEIVEVYPYVTMNRKVLDRFREQDNLMMVLTSRCGLSYSDATALIATDGKSEDKLKTDRETVKQLTWDAAARHSIELDAEEARCAEKEAEAARLAEEKAAEKEKEQEAQEAVEKQASIPTSGKRRNYKRKKPI
jgi:hypothetical protein